MTTPGQSARRGGMDSEPVRAAASTEVMDGRSAYQHIVTQLSQPNTLYYEIIKRLVPERMMLYGDDGWGIAVTPTLIFTESEHGTGLHLLKTPVDLGGDWQRKNIDWDLGYRQNSIPEDLIPEAVAFTDQLVARAKEIK